MEWTQSLMYAGQALYQMSTTLAQEKSFLSEEP